MNAACRVLAACCALAACFSFVGCQSATFEPVYELRVTEAVIEDHAPDDAPDSRSVAVQVTWTADADGLVANVSNPSDTTAIIDWEKAVISVEGEPPTPLVSTAPHTGPDVHQPPTVIPGHGQVIVGMLPAGEAEWTWLPNRAMGGSWHLAAPLFGIAFDPGMSEAERQTIAETAVGRKLMVELPVRTGSRSFKHIYDIRVTGASARQVHR